MDWWNRLLTGHIIGVIDAYGAVHSEFTGDEVKTHELLNKANRNAHCRWRWNHRESLHWFTLESKPTEEQMEVIRAHLTKKFGLLWWENGHHDIDHLLAKCSEETHDRDQLPVLSGVKITSPLIRLVLTGNRVDDVNRFVAHTRIASVQTRTHGCGVDTTVYIHTPKLGRKSLRDTTLAEYRQMFERVTDVVACEYLPFGAQMPEPLAATTG